MPDRHAPTLSPADVIHLLQTHARWWIMPMVACALLAAAYALVAPVAALGSLLAIGLAAAAWNDVAAAPIARSQGVLMLAVLVSYLASALFHDLTLLPMQHWLLFLFAALTLRMANKGFAIDGMTE